MSNDVVILKLEEWELIRDAVADIACWHMGFRAAMPTYEEPPQLQKLSALIGDLKDKVRKS